MNYRKILGLLLAAAMLVLSGCGGDSAPPEDETDIPVSDVPETGLAIRRAQNFHIAYLGDDVKLLTDSAGRELLLVPEGSEAPSGYDSAIQVSTPIKRAMFVSAAHVGFLGALEEESLYDSIAAVTTEVYQWNTPQIADRFASGQISYIEQNAWVEGDVESIAATAPDLVFVDISAEGGAALCTKLDELGIPYTVAAENRDIGAESYLEWLKFFGAFYNLDQKASDLYDGKMDYLEELYQKAASVPESGRPVVAVGVADSGIVYTQGGDSALAQQLERAGAIYALKDLDGSGMVELGMEEFLEKCGDADILIYDTLSMYMWGTLLDEDPSFAEFQAYQNQRVYTKDNNYYMNSAKIVEKFEDLLAICHPEMVENYVFTIYQPLQNY